MFRFEVSYSVTKNAQGKEQNSARVVKANSEDEAEEMVLAQLDRDFPESHNTVLDVQELE